MDLLTGKEAFTNNGESIGLSVLDYWSYQFSNILHDPDEIAEFLVAKALGVDIPTNREIWTLYDIDYKGIRVEVKETSYYHSFNEPGKVSNQRSFSIRKTNTNHLNDELEPVYQRNNDVYVFCLLLGDNPEDAWPLELSHWEFYVVPTQKINEECGEQKSITLNRVKTLAEPITFNQLKQTVDELIK